jgi:hypothetical protein
MSAPSIRPCDAEKWPVSADGGMIWLASQRCVCLVRFTGRFLYVFAFPESSICSRAAGKTARSTKLVHLVSVVIRGHSAVAAPSVLTNSSVLGLSHCAPLIAWQAGAISKKCGWLFLFSSPLDSADPRRSRTFPGHAILLRSRERERRRFQCS